MWSRCRINHTVILDDPFDDPPDLPVPDRSPEPTKEQLDVSAPSSGPVKEREQSKVTDKHLGCFSAERSNRSG